MNGTLTPGTKQAVRDYMFSIFAVGGTIATLVAGGAGYMISDLAHETALTVALTEMQKPLVKKLDELAELKADI